jgi:hypothetical protein
MVLLSCGTCGIQFCVPDEYLRCHARDGEDISCPNGHTSLYETVTEESDTSPSKGGREQRETVELRRQLMKAIHDADQAEARKLDGKPPAE